MAGIRLTDYCFFFWRGGGRIIRSFIHSFIHSFICWGGGVIRFLMLALKTVNCPD